MEWLTYQQAAEALGLSPEAVRRRAIRLKWRQRPGNNGRMLVLIPEDASEHVRPRPPVQPPEEALDTRALAEAIAAFREAEDKLRAEHDAALALVAVEQSRADRAEGEAAALRKAVRVAEAATKRLDQLLYQIPLMRTHAVKRLLRGWSGLRRGRAPPPLTGWDHRDLVLEKQLKGRRPWWSRWRDR